MLKEPVRSSALPEIIIFGATHIGIKLANRLAKEGRVLLIDRALDAPEPPAGWEYVCGDLTAPDNVDRARVVFAVTDEDKLNIRIALEIRNASASVPIIITLVQSRLGRKLSRHLEHFAFVSPPELAARKFVDAVYAPSMSASVPRAQARGPDTDEGAPSRIDPLIIRAIGAVAVVALLSAIYFHYSEQLSWVNSFYFVVTTMTTVGFGDISLRESGSVSKIVGIILMLTSVTSAAIIFALITDSLLKQRLALVFGRRRVKLSDHVLVVGMGSVGLKVVEELLNRGETVVAIEEKANGRYLPAIYAKRIPTVIGDAKLERILRDGCLTTARALVSVTNDDLTNLEIGLNAKALNPGARVVLRIYDQVLAQSLHERLDIHFAVSMSSVAAEELARLVDD
jgi:Trk K+ transport system NAD-binding subunit